MFLAPRQFRLARRPEKAGLCCDADGVSLSGVPLLRKTGAGFAPRSALEIGVLTRAGYGAAFDTYKLIRGLAVASQALNEGDLGRAMIATLHLRLPDLGADGARRLAAVDMVLAKYSPDELRDWHGRWTSGGTPDNPSDAAEDKRPALGSHAAPPARASPSRGPTPEHLESHPTGGRLIQTDWDGGNADTDDGESPGYGDNSGARPASEGRNGPEPEPDPGLPTAKVPPGWDQPYRVINGVPRPAGRYPTLPDGRPWPSPQAEVVYRMLDPRRGALPFVRLYVPLDGKGPVLMGTTEQGGDYVEPPGYQPVFLRGVPQWTMSGGVETKHALESVVRALEFAETDRYSDIYFNRSFSTISDGTYNSSLRGDVVGRVRPSLEFEGEYDVFEVLSPRQSGPAREQSLRNAVPGIRHFNSQAYKLLLKLLRALGIS